jgi:hypothetical protein
VFPVGSLLPFLTAQRDQEQLAIISACVTGPIDRE